MVVRLRLGPAARARHLSNQSRSVTRQGLHEAQAPPLTRRAGMGPMPIGPWRLVGKRSLADRLVIAVAWLVMVAAVTLLAAGAMYSDAVARSGLLRTLRDAGPTQANIEVSALVPADGAADADAKVTGRLDGALGAARGELVRFGRSESFAMPDQPAEGVRNLAVFGFAERIEEH